MLTAQCLFVLLLDSHRSKFIYILCIVIILMCNLGEESDSFLFHLSICSRGSLHKLRMPTIFQVVSAGYWVKFSTSNNHASDKPHWLWYRHCAKLPIEGIVNIYNILSNIKNGVDYAE